MLLAAMMIYVAVMRRTGLFQYIAIKSTKLVGGDPLKLLLLFVVVTAVISSFFPNATTVLLISPITLLACAEFRISPVPFLITQAIASNLGGTATLIGDPPNIMIGSFAKLSFVQFIIHLAPLVAIVLTLYLLFLRFTYRKKVGYTSAEIRARLATMNESKSITDKKLLKVNLVILFLIILAFLFQPQLGLELGVIALCGAAFLLIVSRSDIVKILEEVEWATLLFFICIYIVIGAVKEAGLLKEISTSLVSVGPRNDFLFVMLIMWISAFISSIVGAAPLTATMIPIVDSLIKTNPKLTPLWWALAIGACFGGNMTFLGTAANVTVAGIAEMSGHQITFKTFLSHGMPVTIVALLVSSLYIFLRYFLN
jgi:Na+/H+ antiporter NhaD/arsenite permease-like protein